MMRSLFPPRIALIFTFAALCLSSHPVRADLLLPDEGKDTARHALWCEVWESLPNALRPRRDVCVREVSDAEMERLVSDEEDEFQRTDDGSVVDGMYVLDKKDGPAVITLRRSLRDKKAARVFAHELGHAAWDERVSGKWKRRCADAYRRSREEDSLVSEYAGESLEEGFAESFSYYLRDPQTLKRRDPRAYVLLEEMCSETE